MEVSRVFGFFCNESETFGIPKDSRIIKNLPQIQRNTFQALALTTSLVRQSPQTQRDELSLFRSSDYSEWNGRTSKWHVYSAPGPKMIQFSRRFAKCCQNRSTVHICCTWTRIERFESQPMDSMSLPSARWLRGWIVCKSPWRQRLRSRCLGGGLCVNMSQHVSTLQMNKTSFSVWKKMNHIKSNIKDIFTSARALHDLHEAPVAQAPQDLSAEHTVPLWDKELLQISTYPNYICVLFCFGGLFAFSRCFTFGILVTCYVAHGYTALQLHTSAIVSCRPQQ